MSEKPISLHVLIATIGRPTLLNMLRSINLNACDHLTVVFDNVDQRVSDHVRDYIIGICKCEVHVHNEPYRLGSWGHGIRNKYQDSLDGDFLLHADDDDEYTSGAFDVIRRICSSETANDEVNVFLLDNPSKSSRNIVKFTSTPCGAIPMRYAKKGIWGSGRGGDYSYYDQLREHIRFIYHPDVIYKVRPSPIRRVKFDQFSIVRMIDAIRITKNVPTKRPRPRPRSRQIRCRRAKRLLRNNSQ